MGEQLIGLEEFRAWLKEKGFKFAKKPFLPNDIDKCNWYAYRPTVLDCRPCEHNEDRPLQIVVSPYQFDSHTSAEMDVTGEHAGVWYQFKAYGLSVSESQARLDELERSLVNAWNAVGG